MLTNLVHNTMDIDHREQSKRGSGIPRPAAECSFIVRIAERARHKRLAISLGFRRLQLGRILQVRSESEDRIRLRTSLAYLIFSLCALLYLYPFVKVLFLPDADEGTLLYDAVRVTEGQIPFRDFFEIIGPGSFYWLAAFFKLFGMTFVASRIPVALDSFGIAVLMYFLMRRLNTAYAPLPAAFFVTILFGHLWPTVNYHTDSTFFALLSFACLVSWIDTNRSFLLWVAGALAGATTLFLQPKGLFLIVSFLFIVVWFRGREALVPLGRLVGGYVSAIATVVLLYWKAGALTNLVYANVVWPLRHYSAVNHVPYGQGLLESWASLEAALEQLLPPVIAGGIATVLRVPQFVIAGLPLILTVFAFYYKRLAINRLTLPYWAVGAALWLSELHRSDMSHLIYGSPVLLMLLFHALGGDRRMWSRHAIRALCAAVLALAGFNLLLVHTSNKLVTPRGALNALGTDPVLEFLDAHLKPGQDIFVYPYRPLYYFLTGARNPTRYSILVYHMNTEAQFRKALNSLQHANLAFVVWDPSPLSFKALPAYSPPPKAKLIIEPYLASHYEVVKSYNGIDILQRKIERSAGKPPILSRFH